MSDVVQKPLTRAVKRILDYLRVLTIAALVLWPLAVLVLSIGQSSDPDTWGVDIGFLSGFKADVSEFEGGLIESAGVRDPVISGKAVINIDTSSLQVLYVFTAITEVGGIVGLYVLLQLRALFASLASGVSFAPENSLRIRKIGIVVIAWSLLHPLIQYFGGQVILKEYALNVPGFELHPAAELKVIGIIIGLVMIVLAGVLKEAADIYETQQLTI